MTRMTRFEPGERLIGRLRRGEDLLETLTELCTKHNIRSGWLSGLGAVERARIGYYDQEKREYAFLEIEDRLEITNLTGNISLKEGVPMVHAHITLADASGKVYGGHLAPGTVAFACELIIEVLQGTTLERKHDAETGLALLAFRLGSARLKGSLFLAEEPPAGRIE